MKLFSRYTLINLVANIGIFLIACVAFYFSLRYILIRQVDDDLHIEEEEIKTYVLKYDRLPESVSLSDQVIGFTPILNDIPRRITNFSMREQGDHDPEEFRQLNFTIRAGGKAYKATVTKSIEGTNRLIGSILVVSITTILMILAASVIINRFLMKRLWNPFYRSLKAIRNFRVSKNHPLILPETNIEEFTLMNKTFEAIADNSRTEYLLLKTFSENASHEIQTPIAIIRSKLDLLIQDSLSEKQSIALQSAFNSIEKLSRMNQSLLLLARIGNNQFEEVTSIDLKQKLEEKLRDFQELCHSKSISLKVSLQHVTVKMNNALTDILLNNLLSNATNHNYEGGTITIKLTSAELTVRNTSKHPALPEAGMYQRFYKQSKVNSNNGLGLSIIRQIAEVSGVSLNYYHENDMHTFTIKLQK